VEGYYHQPSVRPKDHGFLRQLGCAGPVAATWRGSYPGANQRCLPRTDPLNPDFAELNKFLAVFRSAFPIETIRRPRH